MASAWTTLVAFAGCTGTVATSGQGEATSSGAGGAQVTASSSGGTMVTVSSSSSTSSSGAGGAVSASSSGGTGGGPALCDQGCAHAKMCGFDVCKMYNINCATVGDQYDCVLACVNGESCQQLFGGGALSCYQMCKGMVSDGGQPNDGGPPMLDGGPAAQCGQCAIQSCQSQVFGCGQNPTCQPWGQCALGCFQMNPTASCFAACDAMYPGAQAEYDPVYACLCSSCSTQCASADPCNHSVDGG